MIRGEYPMEPPYQESGWSSPKWRAYNRMRFGVGLTAAEARLLLTPPCGGFLGSWQRSFAGRSWTVRIAFGDMVEPYRKSAPRWMRRLLRL